MKTKDGKTAVPSAQKAQRPPHKNEVTKITFGQGDWALMKLTEFDSPTDALGIIEDLILKHASRNQWREIVHEPYSPLCNSHVDLFGIWVRSVNEVFGLGTWPPPTTIIPVVNKATRLLDLIDEMIAIIPGSIDSYAFDSMSCVLLECIISCSPSAEAMELWYRFLALGDKRRQFSGPVFHPDTLSSQFEQIFNQHLNFEKAAWLIEVTATRGVNLKPVEKAIAQLWLCLTTRTGLTKQQVEWARIILSMNPFQGQDGNPAAVEACIRTVNEICKFARAFSKLRWLLMESKLPISEKQPVIKADYRTQVVSEIVVLLNGGHADFCTKNLADQQKLAQKCADQITTVVSDWANKNDIKNTFDLKIVSTLIEPTNMTQFLRGTKDFKVIASIHTANS